MRRFILIPFCFTLVPMSVGAQPTLGPVVAVAKAPFMQSEARTVVDQLASKLEEMFVFPEVGKAYASMLRAKLAAGGYDRFANADAFAEAVTADLLAIQKDGHLRLFPPRLDAPVGAGQLPAPPSTGAVLKSGWLADGVAYIRFESFPGNPATLADVKRFLVRMPKR